MTREEFIKQRCEIDKITLEEFEEQYRVVECNCGQPYCNGYICLDLDDLLKENQELKKQVEEYKKELECTIGIVEHNRIISEKNKKIYQLKGLYNTCLPYITDYNKAIEDKETQQKEFIKYLKDMLDNENDIFSVARVKDVLEKYKKIIGVEK